MIWKTVFTDFLLEGNYFQFVFLALSIFVLSDTIVSCSALALMCQTYFV